MKVIPQHHKRKCDAVLLQISLSIRGNHVELPENTQLTWTVIDSCKVCKWSKEFDIKPHRCSRRTVQSYSPRGANLSSHKGILDPLVNTIELVLPTAQLPNTIELVLPSAYPSPQPTRQIDRFSHFCTAHGRKSLYFTMGAPFPKNCPFPWGICTPI